MPLDAPLPQYQCTNAASDPLQLTVKVWALKIRDADFDTDGSVILRFEEVGNTYFEDKAKGAEWGNLHEPKAGGYWVQWPDGYESYSPAEAFEKGFAPVN
ncbi:MAG: hypothetical protein E6Q97_10705 [Desulfurellales bacterium]|nr:MAG: hypothetical protein E6Q97_10705 [Desulfurellales bacterium]